MHRQAAWTVEVDLAQLVLERCGMQGWVWCEQLLCATYVQARWQDCCHACSANVSVSNTEGVYLKTYRLIFSYQLLRERLSGGSLHHNALQ